MPEGGKLTIEINANGDFTAVVVTDTDIGIKQKNINKIFEPLFTTRLRCIGLGLSISKNLMEANGSKIEVESVCGEGISFVVKLTLAEV